METPCFGRPLPLRSPVTAQVFRWDELGVETRLLRAGAEVILQPPRHGLAPLATPSDPDWGPLRPVGWFLSALDLTAAVLGDLPGLPQRRLREAPPPDAFHHLEDMLARRPAPAAAAARLREIARAWREAASDQRGAEGFDNSEQAARSAARQAELLREARATWAALLGPASR